MRRTLFTLAALVTLSASASDEKVTGAEIVEFGVFEKIASEGRMDAQKSLSGEINAVMEAKLKDKMITCSFCCSHPKLTDPTTGHSSESDAWSSQPRIGHPRYTGYTFDNDWELVPGKWIVQAIYDSKVLAEKTFDVVLPH
jgi:hypothetical protein